MFKLFSRKKNTATIDTVLSVVKPALAGDELVKKVNDKSAVVESRGVCLVSLQFYGDTLEVRVSIEASALLVAQTLGLLTAHYKWRVHHLEFIQTENNVLLWGPEAQHYYATREILMRAIPGMVLDKESLC